ncbi:low specificity L-threonine aldolase [Rufibacter glacialis]|uniref:Aminotransferase class I/II-fold pyridoxal phosphate-dependent enzyme n=1 Tax=Rufibacter glacialis TaxID=1259555 RepID=A0A5M8QJN5_9BACT|nr:GntG family PLP-dependent aldolase [Rufibacter glacialis]KAA6434542.1 aminotransferase class I/II-fold pyridoxal phosphate-dependent enzyme [Rufibacter glacialis]GGK70501.1 threonine aldolase [Rufibacter glacialis]
MNPYIDLRSDTVTKPTPAMLEAMFQAQVGDDVYSEDPTVNELQAYGAHLFGMEAGLFCPSGTMTNQIAIKLHTQPLSEVICERNSHIYVYEGGGIAFNSAASVQLLDGVRGKISPEQVAAAINPDNIHFPVTSLVSLENTCNKGGGSYYTLPEIAAISEVCQKHHLPLHLDGARVFNALVASGEEAREYGRYFDTISVCLSKGLGAPVGSLLLGPKPLIEQAKRVRKVLGGGWRQAGFLAAAGLYALQNHVTRLQEDHDHATLLGNALAQAPYVASVMPVETNIVIFTLAPEVTTDAFLGYLAQKGIQGTSFGPQMIRFVTHLDLSPDMVTAIIQAIEGYQA